MIQELFEAFVLLSLIGGLGAAGVAGSWVIGEVCKHFDCLRRDYEFYKMRKNLDNATK